MQDHLQEAQRLKDIANDLLEIAAGLELSAPPQAPEDQADNADANAEKVGPLSRLAREEYRQRRLRTLVFGDNSLFGEPAWDILLDLFIAEHQGKRLAVTSVCIGAAVPTTTALRWIGVLEHKGLVHREHDPSDGRRAFIRLSQRGSARMSDYFNRISLPGPFVATADEDLDGLIVKD